MGELFLKKLCMEEETFLAMIFYMGTNDQIMQVGKLMVKRFQRSSQVTTI